MDLGLDGKAAIVTGGRSGIGAAIALRLAREGCDVAIVDRLIDERARQVVQDIEAAGRSGLAIEADVHVLRSTDGQKWEETYRVNALPDDRDPQFLASKEGRTLRHERRLARHRVVLRPCASHSSPGGRSPGPTTLPRAGRPDAPRRPAPGPAPRAGHAPAGTGPRWRPPVDHRETRSPSHASSEGPFESPPRRDRRDTG